MSRLPRLRPLEILRLPDREDGPSYLLRDPLGFTEAELVLSEAALFAAAYFDGEHGPDELAAGWRERFGTEPDAAEVQGLAEALDAAYFLENDTFTVHAETRMAEFRAQPVRAAAHAGVSYEAEPQAAAAQIEAFLAAAPALEEPGDRPAGRLRGIVAPHIDLRVGGETTALAYLPLVEAESVETVIVLGTSHACPDPEWIVLDKPYATPLGDVPVDVEAAETLARAAGASDLAQFYHHHEHSVEFAAVFLAALRRRGRNLRLVPVLAGAPGPEPAGDHDPFLAELRTLLTERGDRAIVVASADLAHVGPRFGDPEELSEHHLQLLEKRDRATLVPALERDPAAFFAAVTEAGDPRRICGLGAIHGLLRVLPEGARGKLLRYEQAADPSGTVSYASAAFWGGAIGS